MEKMKKLKIYLGISYIILISTFLYYFFSKFSLQEVSSYDFIKNNVDYFSNLKNKIRMWISKLYTKYLNKFLIFSFFPYAKVL